MNDRLRSRDRVARAVLYVLLIGGLLLVVGPFAWMLLSSFKPEGEIRADPPTWLPNDPTFANYGNLFDRLDFPTFFTNSAVVAVLTTVGNLLFCSAAGYALAKLPFAGRKILFAIVLGTLMVPSIVTMVPLFVLSSNLGLVNTLAGLILPYLAQAFGVFLMRQFILSIPNDLLEAARIDAASELRIFWQIVLPMSRPILATLAVMRAIGFWDEWLWPMITVLEWDVRPVALQVFYLQGNVGGHVGYQMAGYVISSLPLVILFALASKQFVRGLTSGAIRL